MAHAPTMHLGARRFEAYRKKVGYAEIVGHCVTSRSPRVLLNLRPQSPRPAVPLAPAEPAVYCRWRRGCGGSSSASVDTPTARLSVVAKVADADSQRNPQPQATRIDLELVRCRCGSAVDREPRRRPGARRCGNRDRITDAFSLDLPRS